MSKNTFMLKIYPKASKKLKSTSMCSYVHCNVFLLNFRSSLALPWPSLVALLFWRLPSLKFSKSFTSECTWASYLLGQPMVSYSYPSFSVTQVNILYVEFLTQVSIFSLPHLALSSLLDSAAEAQRVQVATPRSAINSTQAKHSLNVST